MADTHDSTSRDDQAQSTSSAQRSVGQLGGHVRRAGREGRLGRDLPINPLYTRVTQLSVPRLRMREEGLLPETAYQIVHDEVYLDGNARQNLATFVGTWMDPLAGRLYSETVDKNMIDKDEYPQTAEVESRCVHILADLWNAPHPHRAPGVSTIGSSEACMLGGLAFKRRWQRARRAAGKAADRPNIVFSSAVQVVWEKFANYFEVEPRYVPVSAEHPYLDPESMLRLVDENTIGVVPIMGVTYTGVYEPVAEIARALDDLQERSGLDVPIHVDAASGGFVAPFLQPDTVWDFRLPRVQSINASGHKFGLVYPGVGWALWREPEALPEELVMRVSYLGGDMPTFGLNFSRPGAQVLLQYFNFLRLGRNGYTRVQRACRDVAVHLSGEIAKMGMFELLSDGSDIPVFAWRLREGYTRMWDLYDLSNKLRERGWQVPAYPMPADLQDITVMRVVVRNGVSADLAELLLSDIRHAVDYLDHLAAPMPKEKDREVFHH
jgi:glutamate decarboxylase